MQSSCSYAFFSSIDVSSFRDFMGELGSLIAVKDGLNDNLLAGFNLTPIILARAFDKVLSIFYSGL